MVDCRVLMTSQDLCVPFKRELSVSNTCCFIPSLLVYRKVHFSQYILVYILAVREDSEAEIPLLNYIC